MTRKAVRNALAAAFRKLPAVRGRGRIGASLHRLLTPAVAGPDEAAVVLKNGVRLTLDVRSVIGRGVFWDGYYDPVIVDALRGFITPGAVFLDVGANVGLYVAQLAPDLRAAGGRVVAFEPFPDNLRRLRELVAANGLDGTVTVAPYALGRETADAAMARGAGETAPEGNAFITPDATGVAVRVRRLDDVAGELNLDRCDIVKIDVEGFEVAVVDGGAAFLERTRPVLVCELNAYWMEAHGWTAADLTGRFVPRGYSAFVRVGRRFEPVTVAPVGIEDLVLVPTEKLPLFRMKL